MEVMSVINLMLDAIRGAVRGVMHAIAVALNRISGDKLHPDTITTIGLLAHLGIAYLITIDSLLWAALTLVIFGLFDTLDGELARLQKRASSAGMLYDAVTDRFKEVFLYTAIALYFIETPHPTFAAWAVLACGASICVSYVKAKGETAVKDSKLTSNQINRLFQDGLIRFEVRMFLLVVGLVANRLDVAVVVIAIASALTAVGRLIRIRRSLA